MLSREQIEILENNRENITLLSTLELSHSSLSKTYYFVKYIEDKEFYIGENLKVSFKATNLNVKLPNFNHKLDMTLDFQLDIITSEVVEELNNLLNNPNSEEKLKVVFRQYASNNDKSPIFGPIYFYASSFEIKDYKLIVSAKSHELINTKFVKDTYTEYIFKGLRYV